MSTAPRPGRTSVVTAVVAAIAGLVVGAFRFLALTGFPDDHYVSLAGAQQMLFGAWPSRDFVDLGAPLTYAISAAAQALIGRGIYSEAVLMAVVFALAAVVTLYAATALTGSRTLGLAAVALEVLIFPRTYSYPKMLVYSTACLLLVRYAYTPTTWRMVGLAVFSVTAFLVRHDLGLYVGIGALAAVALATPPRRSRAGTIALFITTVVLLALPYLAYLQATGGVLEHLTRGLTFARLEMPRQRLTLEGAPFSWVWLLGAIWAAPVLAAAVVLGKHLRGASGQGATARVEVLVPLIALAVVGNLGMIRDSLPVRLPDAVVPPAILLAWLVRQAWGVTTPVWSVGLRFSSAALLLLTLAASGSMGATIEQLDRVGLFSRPDLIGQRFGERTRELRRPWVGRQAPSAAALQMAPFFDYVERCVPERDRLLVPNFLPEVPVLAGRAFAGGQVWFMAGTMNSAADHLLVMERLRSERVPLVIVRRPNFDLLAAEFPELSTYVMAYQPVARWSLGADDVITLAANPALARGTDPDTGWPCFR